MATATPLSLTEVAKTNMSLHDGITHAACPTKPPRNPPDPPPLI